MVLLQITAAVPSYYLWTCFENKIWLEEHKRIGKARRKYSAHGNKNSLNFQKECD